MLDKYVVATQRQAKTSRHARRGQLNTCNGNDSKTFNVFAVESFWDGFHLDKEAYQNLLDHGKSCHWKGGVRGCLQGTWHCAKSDHNNMKQSMVACLWCYDAVVANVLIGEERLNLLGFEMLIFISRTS